MSMKSVGVKLLVSLRGLCEEEITVRVYAKGVAFCRVN